MTIEKGDATKYVHTGNGELCYELNKALTVPETFPIYLSSAYIFDSIDPIDKICDEGAPGYAYFRLGNPNADATSQILAAGDGGEKGLVFSSGMAAITTSILATVKPGDHIVASPIIYGEAFYYLKYELKRWGVETTFIDFNTQDVADYIRPNTKLVYGETIANPLMSVPDIQHLADVAHANGAKLFIDNTFATSIIAKPIKYGADLVIYSATKYLGGHDDLVGGAVVGSEEIIKSLSFYLGLYGANLGATESWLLARSLRTLPLRVKKMAEKLITLAVKEKDNFETVKVSAKVPKKDAEGKRVKEVVDGKKVTVYETVEKEIKKDLPSRLHARKQMDKVLYTVTEVPTAAAGKKKNTKTVDLTNKLFDEIAPKYAGRQGGYTRIVKIGLRKGDAAMEVLLELV